MTALRQIPFMLDQYAEDVPTLWQRRDDGVDEPHYNRTFLARLDEQLEAHVDGLRIAAEEGWEAAVEAWETVGDPGEAFTLAVLAFDLDDEDKIGEVLDIVKSDVTRFLRPVLSAIGWLDLGKVRERIEGLLSHSRTTARLVGLGACSVHRHDPGEAFVPLLDDPDPFVRARAARLAGELGRADLLPAIFVQRPGDSGQSRFWTFWAATMLGDRDAGPGFLLDYATQPDNEGWELAFRTGILAAGPDAGWQWLDALPLDPHGITLRIIGFGLLGEVKAVDWLITQMEGTDFGFLAGEAYAMITGVDLEFDDLDTDPPEAYDEGPTDDPDDDDVDMDPNENLPLPNAPLVARHWAALQPRLPEGRLFLGRPRAPESFEHGFMVGYQRQRRAAAFAMALSGDSAPLRNWQAPVRGISLF